MICHASGDWEKPVVPGFVFYYVVQQDKNAKGISIVSLALYPL